MGLRELFVWLSVLGAAVAAGSWWIPARSSFQHQSTEELAAMRDELWRTRESRTTDDYQSRVTTLLVDEELARRTRMRWCSVAAVIGLVGAIVSPASRGRRSKAHFPIGSAEEARLVSKLGAPGLQLGTARRKAAELLGVSAAAPAEVVEAALHAQLAMRDPSRADGLAPDLRIAMLQQRDALLRARDLLRESEPVSGAAPGTKRRG